MLDKFVFLYVWCSAEYMMHIVMHNLSRLIQQFHLPVIMAFNLRYTFFCLLTINNRLLNAFESFQAPL